MPDFKDELTDIMTPPAASSWPLADGWLIVIGVGVCVLIAAIIGFIIVIRGSAGRRWALKEINKIEQEFDATDDYSVLAAKLSILMRRAAMHNRPRNYVAGLVGEDWLTFLDEVGSTTQFGKGIGRYLITAPYIDKPLYDADALLALCRRWVKKNT